MPRATPRDDDPPPQPPVQPDLEDCCHSGCTQCVFDLYDAALERYEIALTAWRQRHQAPPDPQQNPQPKPRKSKDPRTRH
ncbi:oxidoreductase-like domain-containing protein [Paraburkholderia sp. ZP32-5]|uniref:oxidoreductase-like domain-containing protein n=1 Tax=Paraburkholderia sp. ZP32-5 TaxID=2883245 RepID=UPI001F3C08BC|nr:oxidoreductase-like domain-containing protein [Paraburkholderia sp. ZP32-5]